MKMFLVLEDEPLIAMDLKFAFEDAGHEAVTTSDCSNACEVISGGKIAGAVLDVNLGEGRTCEKAANELHRRGIPFVLHTGDLDRVGEYLRDLDAPILSKPRAANQVVEHILQMAS
ncbi:response regulator [Qipengyuania sp. JC766]|uniref:response regulator n=1 Tax=Qipengyuania sp. JC766 TaxID=3232139 RepID=UPI00345B03BB